MQIKLKTITLLALLVLTSQVFGQKKKTVDIKLSGREYVLSEDEYVPFKYTRNFSAVGNDFVTTYEIYNPRTGRLFQIIKATHFISVKKIVVDIQDANGGIFAHINTEETTYNVPSLEPFGFRGSAGALGGNRVPNQLMVKFTNSKFQYIKVVNINATPSGSRDYYNYVLDDKN